MPRRALRCVVDLEIQRVSAPGVWLPSREDVYLSICLFGQYRTTRLVTSVFPLPLHEHFVFEKTFYTAVDPSEVSIFLEDELCIVELLQMSDFGTGAIRLASFAVNARDFLYPYPSLCPSYVSGSREMLFTRTIAFPGISPKLEFRTTSVIKESRSIEQDALEDALLEERITRRSRSRSRSRSRARSRSLSRNRSLSRTRTPSLKQKEIISDSGEPEKRSKSAVRSFDDDSYSSDPDTIGKPPFVVRHLEKSLIGRTPGEAPLKAQKLKKKKKSLSRPSSALSGSSYIDFDDAIPCYKPKYHLTEVLRDSYGSVPVYTTKYALSDEDAEVAELTSSYVSPPRPRSTSPFVYKSNYSSRFGRSLSPSPLVSARVERALRRARSRSPSPYRYSPILRTSMDDLAIDTNLVRSRRYYPSYL